MRSLINYSLFFTVLVSCGQKQSGTTNASEILTKNLKAHVVKLADDELEGRGAGYLGEKRAAQYIAANFESLDLASFGDNRNLQGYFQPFSFHALDTKIPWETRATQNVVGYLQGQNDEYIVVGGHHDGQGMKGQIDLGRDIDIVVTDSIAAAKDSIWNSAVDNAVSIASILEMARVLTENGIPLKRSIIFTTFSAEESGLNGSIHFANNPPVAKEKIKAMINLEQLVGDPDAEFLYVSYGTAAAFEKVREATNLQQPIEVTPFFPGIIPDTDHFPFTKRNIPAITMGTGSQINIHSSLDHADRLDYELLRTRTEYILTYIISLANSADPFEFTGNSSGLLGVTGGAATEAEKQQRMFEGEAFKVAAVVKDSEGFLAGLQPGDLITAINGKAVQLPRFFRGLEDVIGETDEETALLNVIRGSMKMEQTILLR